MCDWYLEGNDDHAMSVQSAFVNPPFAEAEEWIIKTEQEIQKGNIGCAILLLPFENKSWWLSLIESHPWAVPKGKIHFLRPVPGERDELRCESCPRTICLVPLCGNKDVREKFHSCFLGAMQSLGPVYQPVTVMDLQT